MEILKVGLGVAFVFDLFDLIDKVSHVTALCAQVVSWTHCLFVRDVILQVEPDERLDAVAGDPLDLGKSLSDLEWLDHGYSREAEERGGDKGAEDGAGVGQAGGSSIGQVADGRVIPVRKRES